MNVDDKHLIHILLAGYAAPDKKGLLRQTYWKKNCVEDIAEEKKARGAIATLLRSGQPLTRELRHMLAALFDPTPNTHPAIEREIRLMDRGRGNKSDHMANTEIAMHVYNLARSGKNIEAAVKETFEKYSLQRERVMRIWGRYRPSLEQIYGPLPHRTSKSKAPIKPRP